VLPTGALRYELATRQWIDLFEDPKQALGKLADTINRSLGGSAPAKDVSLGTPHAAPSAITTPPALPSGQLENPEAAKKRPRKKREPLLAPDSAEFEAVRAMLARHIGPIAKVLVQKAASEEKSLEELCVRLAAHVTAPPERAKFLQDARARLSVKS
jgi:serine/threonine-protein kinase